MADLSPLPIRNGAWPNLHVSRHPAILHKLRILRDETTEPKKFREVVRELSWLLGYEALADVEVRPRTVTTPLETTDSHELDVPVTAQAFQQGQGESQPYRFSFRGLAPGDYLAFAFASLEEIEFRNPEFLRGLNGGTSVHIEESGQSNITITSLTR